MKDHNLAFKGVQTQHELTLRFLIESHFERKE